MSQIFIMFMLATFSTSIIASPSPSPLQVKGQKVLSEETITVTPTDSKGLVVVFLSAVCPCSNSHIAELNALQRTFSNFKFVGVHSNSNETKEVTQKYFKSVALSFPVVRDTGAKLADQFKALKTPHAFVIGSNGKTLYQGGVSSSRDIARADKMFLREALNDIKNNRPVAIPEGRTLGCVISRGSKSVW